MEMTIILPDAEQARRMIDDAWNDFYAKACENGYGIDNNIVRKAVMEFFYSGYCHGYNDLLGIVRGQFDAMELEDDVFSEDAHEILEKDKKVWEIGLSIRVINCLRGADIETLGDLLRVYRTDLLKLRNFGRKSLRELDEFFARNGYEWGSERLVPRDPCHVESKKDYLWHYRNGLHLPKKGECV